MTIAVISMIRDVWGGSEELWYQMAKEALRGGHKVIHLAFEHPGQHPRVQELEKMGLMRIVRPGWVPATSGKKKVLYLGINYIRKQIQQPISKLFSLNPDVILYNGTCYSIANEKMLISKLSSNGPKKPKFFILGHLNHDTIRGISNREADLIKRAYQLAEKVFFVSQRNIDTAKRHLYNDINNAQIILNPVNLSSIEPIPFPPLTKGLRFAIVGNLITSHKGQDMLLHALSKWEYKNWVLNIYGSGPDENYLTNLIKYLNLQTKVTLQGTVKEIRNVWKDNHALIMPSQMEGMPLAVVEAMLCARVCIVTDVGGNSEWIDDSKNGFIAPAPTVTALLEVLKRAESMRNNWEEIGLLAHRTAMQKYDPVAGKTLLNKITT